MPLLSIFMTFITSWCANSRLPSGMLMCSSPPSFSSTFEDPPSFPRRRPRGYQAWSTRRLPWAAPGPQAARIPQGTLQPRYAVKGAFRLIASSSLKRAEHSGGLDPLLSGP